MYYSTRSYIIYICCPMSIVNNKTCKEFASISFFQPGLWLYLRCQVGPGQRLRFSSYTAHPFSKFGSRRHPQRVFSLELEACLFLVCLMWRTKPQTLTKLKIWDPWEIRWLLEVACLELTHNHTSFYKKSLLTIWCRASVLSNIFKHD